MTMESRWNYYGLITGREWVLRGNINLYAVINSYDKIINKPKCLW